jgi:hypothetical protein
MEFNLPEAYRLRNERILKAHEATPKRNVSSAEAYEQYHRIKAQSNKGKAKAKGTTGTDVKPEKS